MPSTLLEHWRFTGDDWITALDVLEDELIILGSRSGMLWILNRHGVEIYRTTVGSWIGALRVVDLRARNWPGPLRGVHLIVGTKSGLVQCMRLDMQPLQPIRVEEKFRFAATNTVRDIDFRALSNPQRVHVAVGSEDKHVYIIDLMLALSAGPARAVTKASVNGWIRAVTFIRNPHAEEWLVAAGCGDKNIYFADLAGTIVAKIFVGAKVHSMVCDDETSKIFASSDARDILMVGWVAGAFRVINRTPLPHRATRLAFLAGRQQGTIIGASCDDGTICVYELTRRELVARLEVGRRVFVFKSILWNKTRLLLLGMANGRLGAYTYNMAEEQVPLGPLAVRGEIQAEPAAQWSIGYLASAFLFGLKRRIGNVGIGRFIHLIDGEEGSPRFALIGCDGGDIYLVDIADDFGRVVFQTGLHRPARVWAVYGFRPSAASWRIYAATSDKEVRVHELSEVDGRVELTPDAEPPITLADWPREIRPAEGLGNDSHEGKPLLIVCESGDVVLTGAPRLRFNNGQVMRTGFAALEDGEYLILTGSDNNLVSLFRNSAHQWSFQASDRVRETVIIEGLCLAVSEDRCLYVLDRKGVLQWRYRFPHRALCIEVMRRDGEVSYVVGCGDGHVYQLSSDGFVQASHEFPDRIRDIKFLDQTRFVVVCDDGWLYCGYLFEPLIGPGADDDFYRVLDQEAGRLRVAHAKQPGVAALAGRSSEEKLLLLEYAEIWVEPGDSELVIALMDSLYDHVGNGNSARACYIFATSLFLLATRLSFSAGRSRLEGFLKDFADNPYAVHAVVASIAHFRVAGRLTVDESNSPVTLIDSVIASIALRDDWIAEELVRSLASAGFFDLTRSGFVRFGNTTAASSEKLTEIISKAEASLGDGTDLTLLLRAFRTTQIDRLEYNNVRDRLTAEDLVVECVERFGVCRWPVDGLPQTFAGLLGWATGRLVSPAARALLSNAISEIDSEGQSRSELRMLARLVQNQFEGKGVLISAADFLVVQTLTASLRALSIAVEPGRRRGNND